MTDWGKLTDEEKCHELGEKGEQYIKEKLGKDYPSPKFVIFRLHELCELDWGIIDAESKLIKLIEVKTTTKKKVNEFPPGGNLQLAIAQLQKDKKARGDDFIPVELFVVYAEATFWQAGFFRPLRTENYTLDEITISINCDRKLSRWKVIDKTEESLLKFQK